MDSGIHRSLRVAYMEGQVMGKNSRAKTKKKNLSIGSKGMYVNKHTLGELEKEFVETTKKKWLGETEDRLRAIFLVAEKEAFMKLAALTVLGNKELFGHGRQRLAKIVDYLLFQYSCIMSAHVAHEDLIGLVKDETGICMTLTKEEKDVLLHYAVDGSSERSNKAFKELIEKGRKDGRFSSGAKAGKQKKEKAV